MYIRLPEVMKIIKIQRLPKMPFIVIYLGKTLKRGAQCEVKMTFSGKMPNETSEGLFRHHYIDTITCEKKWYVATRFRPNLARKAFPCLDEPGLKAKFLISVARQKHMRTLSNMPLESSEEM